MTIAKGLGKQLSTGIWEVDRDDLRRLLNCRPGLIIGPSFVHEPEYKDTLSEYVCGKLGLSDMSLDQIICSIDSRGQITETNIRLAIHAYYSEQAQLSPQAKTIAHIRWSAIYSFCQSSNFEQELRDRQSPESGRPLAHKPTVIDDNQLHIEPQAFPLIKLNGTYTFPDFPLTEAQYRIRRKKLWRHYIPLFRDHVQASPILCVGMSGSEEDLFELLAEIAAQSTATPSSLMFLADDPFTNNRDLSEYLPPSTTTVHIRAGLKDVQNATQQARASEYSLTLNYDDKDEPLSFLDNYAEIATSVNRQLVSNIDPNEHNFLLELLFQPSNQRWDPYTHSLDFRRNGTSDLQSLLESVVSTKSFESQSIVMHGPTACGKTTTLKRVALELAKKDYMTIWLRPTFLQDAPKRIEALFSDISKHAIGPVFVIFDNPSEFPTYSPADIVTSAASAGQSIVLIVSCHDKEWQDFDVRDELSGSLPITDDFAIDPQLTDDEMDRLAPYLTRLGVAQNEQEAKHLISNASSKYASDILGLLYFLIPNTRMVIQSSLTAEYVKLGDTSSLNRLVKDTAIGSSQVIQEAYSMVAVAHAAHTVLPIEVLVSALDIDYSEWVQAFNPDTPIWGLLYSDYSPEGETVAYRTRNSKIAEIIVQVINGGVLSHAAEHGFLRHLLESCSGYSPAYASFCRAILVPPRKLSRFEYDEGLDLYDAALDALPARDKTILHHKGIYVHKTGRNPELALEILEEALATKPYPYGTRTERDEHIRTSMAACIATLMKNRRIKIEEGLQKVSEYLSEARSETFFSARAIHVEAGVTIEACVSLDEAHASDAFQLASDAIGSIDRTLLVLKTDGAASDEIATDVQLLGEARENVIDAVLSPTDLAQQAFELWEAHKRQEGFVVVGRRLLGQALNVDARGKKFKEIMDFYDQAVATINAEGERPSSSLVELGLHTYYNWRVRKSVFSESTEPIDWNFLYDSSSRIIASRNNTDPLVAYIQALALAHMNRWPESRARFNLLAQRRLPAGIARDGRDLLLGDYGGARSVQGRIRRLSGKTFLYVADLESDILVHRPRDWPAEGLVATGYIEFSFMGARAIASI